METKNKLLILSLSFAIFIVGVRALYSEPGVVRNGVLAASVMGWSRSPSCRRCGR